MISGISFLIGLLTGIYAAQEYNIPPVKVYAKKALIVLFTTLDDAKKEVYIRNSKKNDDKQSDHEESESDGEQQTEIEEVS